jgi:hypothetical protein
MYKFHQVHAEDRFAHNSSIRVVPASASWLVPVTPELLCWPALGVPAHAHRTDHTCQEQPWSYAGGALGEHAVAAGGAD